MKAVALILALLWTACGAEEKLDLSHSGLEAAPEDLCTRPVRVANLCANKLREVPPCCRSLRRLYLYRNNIEQLPEGWLADCPFLEELSVSGNPLQRLPAGLLSSSSSLRRLQASRNLLHSLPPQLLTNATSLTELDLSHNSLTELPQGVLDTTSQLVELFLQANNLTDPPEDLLARCGRLRVLWLSHNRLTRLPRPLLAGSPLLRSLRLDHNLIADVAAGAFDNNHDIQLLDLSSNRLTSLPAGLFVQVRSLRRLLLADNLLRAVPGAGSLPSQPQPQPQPVLVDLSHNLLQTVSAADLAAVGRGRALLGHNAWCRDLLPAAPLAALSGPGRSRWFPQRAVRYDRLHRPLAAGAFLKCAASTLAPEDPAIGATEATADMNAAYPAATLHENRGTLTQSEPTSETITLSTKTQFFTDTIPNIAHGHVRRLGGITL